MDDKQETIDTYNKSAKELAKYFRGIGSRVKDIDLTLKLAGSPKDPKVLEIGCGDGRDAKEIVKRAKDYVGFDISKELIKLAREHVPGATFKVADAVNFNYEKYKNLDAVFAFASLLHLDKRETKKVLDEVHKSLRSGGVFFISLKFRPQYESDIKEDEYGRRLFYFYNPELITELAGDKYEVANEVNIEIKVRKVEWFDIALRKK